MKLSVKQFIPFLLVIAVVFGQLIQPAFSNCCQGESGIHASHASMPCCPDATDDNNTEQSISKIMTASDCSCSFDTQSFYIFDNFNSVKTDSHLLSLALPVKHLPIFKPVKENHARTYKHYWPDKSDDFKHNQRLLI